MLILQLERLGNVAEGAWLREAIGKILESEDGLIMRRVLYSMSHSGYLLEMDEYPRLRKEIALLKARGGADLKDFVESMESLISVAEAEHNPIVLV
jgi:hypothetical protein